MDRGQAGVAAPSAVAALVFEVVWERADQRRAVTRADKPVSSASSRSIPCPGMRHHTADTFTRATAAILFTCEVPSRQPYGTLEKSHYDERQSHGTESAERSRHRTRHRDAGRRGIHRRHVWGLLTVPVPATDAAVPAATGGGAAFDPGLRWRLHPQVAVRPEPFGALLYHFGTRKLSFLKNRTIVAVVESLDQHTDARSACRAAGIDDAQQAPYLHALGVLVQSKMLVPGETR